MLAAIFMVSAGAQAETLSMRCEGTHVQESEELEGKPHMFNLEFDTIRMHAHTKLDGAKATKEWKKSDSRWSTISVDKTYRELILRDVYSSEDYDTRILTKKWETVVTISRTDLSYTWIWRTFDGGASSKSEGKCEIVKSKELLF